MKKGKKSFLFILVLVLIYGNNMMAPEQADAATTEVNCGMENTVYYDSSKCSVQKTEMIKISI